MVYLLSLVLLVVMSSLGAVMALQSTLGARQADNEAKVLGARLAAESGLSFHLDWLEGCPASGSDQAALDAIADEAIDILEGTGNMAGQSVAYDGDVIDVPHISFGPSRSFSARIWMPEAGLVRLAVTGYGAGGASIRRTVKIDFTVSASAVASAIVSKGPIRVDNKIYLQSVGEPDDASMASAATGAAVKSYNDGWIDGAIALSEPDAYVQSTGNLSVDGGISTGVGELTFPSLNPAPYVAVATTIVDSGTDVSSGTFTNIRILAGTNPEFDSVTIKGVMYVEAPNVVVFNNSVTIQGVIVTEDPGDGASQASHRFQFNNDVEFKAPSSLPDKAKYAAVRDLPGTHVYAPGFTTYFKNCAEGPVGLMASEKLQCDNKLEVTVYNSICAYGDGGIHLHDDTTITVDRTGGGGSESGGGQLVLSPGTYAELTTSP